MRRVALLGLALLLAVGATLLVGCQSKEVTSAKVYIQQDDWDKAIEQLKMAVKLYPNDPEAHYLLGEGYAMKGDYEGMNREFDASLAISPKFEKQIKATREKYWVRAFNNGIKKYNAQAYDEAIKDFATAAMIDPKRPESYIDWAAACLAANKLDEAVKAVEQGLQNVPDDPKLLALAGEVYLRANRTEDAVKVLEKAVQADPSNAGAVANLARAYHMLGKKDKALETYEKALAANPDNTDLIFNEGLLYLDQKQYDKAAERFKKVLEKNPDDYEANWRLALTYLVLADSLNAPVAERLVNGEDVPKEEIQKVRDAYAKAIPYLEKCVELKPDDPDLWLYLGQAYVRAGFPKKGEEAFKKEKELRGGESKSGK